ncbi:MAG: hypothetical protein REI09_04365 [Candidatus Dactylopiibacterium sp.]|nr:hypothetical protein [Candidatus Dactylopiibacterium sp.]
MKIRAWAVALTTLLVSSPVLADAFTGIYVQGLLGGGRSSTNVRGTASDFDGDYTQNQMLGQIAAGGSQSYGRFSLAVGAFYTVGEQKSGKKTYADAFGSLDANVKLKNVMGITVEPGFYVSPTALVYAKLGYAATTAGVKLTQVTTGGGSRTFNEEGDYNGFLLGAGMKLRFNERLYGVAEVQQVSYNRKDLDYGNGLTVSIKPSHFGAFVGVGARF